MPKGGYTEGTLWSSKLFLRICLCPSVPPSVCGSYVYLSVLCVLLCFVVLCCVLSSQMINVHFLVVKCSPLMVKGYSPDTFRRLSGDFPDCPQDFLESHGQRPFSASGPEGVPNFRHGRGLKRQVRIASLESKMGEIARYLSQNCYREFIAAIRVTSFRWGSYSRQNTEIGPHRPCVRCVATRIARLAFIRVTLNDIPRGIAKRPAKS